MNTLILMNYDVPYPQDKLVKCSPRGEAIFSSNCLSLFDIRRKINIDMDSFLSLRERPPKKRVRGPFLSVRAIIAWVIVALLTTPLYGQSFDALLNELSGSEADQVENETLPPSKVEDIPPIPSSTELQAAELQGSPEEDDFAPVKNIETNGVTLQGLDKQTARVFIINAPVGQPIEFGTLKIIVQHCEKAPLENRQESIAFIRITEQKPNCPVQQLFSGWMFASSPALSALDHPIYDVWVKECKMLN